MSRSGAPIIGMTAIKARRPMAPRGSTAKLARRSALSAAGRGSAAPAACGAACRQAGPAGRGTPAWVFAAPEFRAEPSASGGAGGAGEWAARSAAHRRGRRALRVSFAGRPGAAAAPIGRLIVLTDREEFHLAAYARTGLGERLGPRPLRAVRAVYHAAGPLNITSCSGCGGFRPGVSSWARRTGEAGRFDDEGRDQVSRRGFLAVRHAVYAGFVGCGDGEQPEPVQNS